MCFPFLRPLLPNRCHRNLPPQPVRSFKVRGAFNKMSRLTPEQLAKGVVCSSAGNHAQVGGS